MRRSGWCLAALLTAACAGVPRGGAADPDGAVLAFYREPLQVSVPETAVAGQPFTVAIRTYGGGCVGQGTTEVSLEDRIAHLRPRDVVPRGEMVCTADLRVYRHEATVRFDHPGRAIVRVYGVRVTPAGETRPLVVTREVLVR